MLHDRLVCETRAAREALHQLVLQLKRDRDAWRAAQSNLLLSPRLTLGQRQALRRCGRRREHTEL